MKFIWCSIGTLFAFISLVVLLFPQDVLALTVPKDFRAAVILVRPTEQTHPTFSSASIQNNIDQTVAYYDTSSYAKVKFTTDTFDNGGSWYHISSSLPAGQSTCNPTNGDIINTYIQSIVSAADPDIDYSKYQGLVIIIDTPGNPCLGGSGVAGFGWSQFISSTEFSGRINISVSNGYTSPITHEFGHMIGLSHAHSLICDEGTFSGKCAPQEYGDPYSYMGMGNLELTAPERAQLGWIPPSEITTVLKDGDYTVGPIERSETPTKAIKVPQAIDPSTGTVTTWYYLEHREAIGLDANKNIYSSDSGITIHYFPYLDSDKPLYLAHSAYLLDMNPGDCANYCDMYNSALAVGKTYTDPTTGMTIAPTKKDGEIITIHIAFAKIQPCIRTIQTLTITPKNQQALPGQTKNYTLSVSNNNQGCPFQKYTLAFVKKVPKNWKVVVDAPLFNLRSGQKKKVTIHITSPKKGYPGGYYFQIKSLATNTSDKETIQFRYGLSK